MNKVQCDVCDKEVQQRNLKSHQQSNWCQSIRKLNLEITCVICYEVKNNSVSICSAGSIQHVVCCNCLPQMTKMECPICKQRDTLYEYISACVKLEETGWDVVKNLFIHERDQLEEEIKQCITMEQHDNNRQKIKQLRTKFTEAKPESYTQYASRRYLDHVTISCMYLEEKLDKIYDDLREEQQIQQKCRAWIKKKNKKFRCNKILCQTHQ